MFGNLKKQAASAAAAGYAGASAGAEKASAAAAAGYASAKDRVDTAAAGKQMVDEGGEPMAQKLLAKKASVDATNFDLKLVAQLPRGVGAYSFAVEKLKAGEVHASGEAPPFGKLASDYQARVSVLTTAMTTLQIVPEYASVSAIESDAIKIVTAKKAASGLRSSLSSVGSASKPAEAGEASPPAEAAVPNDGAAASGDGATGAGAWLQGSVDAAKDRVQLAKDAKKMVDEGGEPMVAKLLGKKASVDATCFDQKLVAQLAQAVAKYGDAAAKLEEAAAPGESPSFEKLAMDYTARAAKFQQVLDSMSSAPEVASVSPMEKDAIIYMVAEIKIKDADTAVKGSIQQAQEKAVEAGMVKAVSGATGGAVTSVPEGSGKMGLKVAQENPELAKAAVSAAAKAAAK